jgi:regulator of nucleoside diphosphate kinase
MSYHPPTGSLPQIIVGEREEHRLTTLATSAMLTGRSEYVARVLLAEMERADIVPDAKLPGTVVRMNSRVTFEMDGGTPRDAELVFPGEANIDQGKISVLTPIGAALIGLARGASIGWETREGEARRLTVLEVARS